MQKTFALPVIITILLFASCEDYAPIREEIIKQTKLMHATALQVKHAESSQSVSAALRRFNDEMETLHESLANNRKRASGLKSLISSPPRTLYNEVNELKTASETLRETLASASLYCEDAQLRKMLVKTAATLEKTLAQ